MRRTLPLAVACLLAGAAAQAQVAAPSIVPALPTFFESPGLATAEFVTLNPAAIQWGGPTRIGVSHSDSKRDESGSHRDFGAQAGGFRLVFQNTAIAAETSRFYDRERNRKQNFETSSGAVSFKPFDWLAVGGGLGNGRRDEVVPPTDNTRKTQVSSYGASVRIGEMFFVGAAAGMDQLDKTDRSTTPATKTEEARPFQIYGVGIRRGGPVTFHIEYYTVHREPYEFGTAKKEDVTAGVGVAELNWAGVLVGYRGFALESKDTGSKEKTTGAQYTLGWAPASGFAILAHLITADVKDDSSGTAVTIKKETRSASVVYQF